MTIKLSDYINDENRKLTPKQIRRFLIDYGFDDVAKARWYIERAFENWDVK